MPKTPNHANFAASLGELAEAGSPVDISVADIEDQNADLEISQVGGIYQSTLFELPNGRSGYILDLEIVNQSPRTIYGSGPPVLRFPWEDSFFDWLADPKETPRRFSYFRTKRNGRRERVDAVSDSYYLPGGAQLEYPRQQVLNHILLEHFTLTPGRPLYGLLLGTGSAMPAELRHGRWLETTLSLCSSRHLEYTATIRLWIDRSQAKAKPARKYSLRGEQVGTVGSTVPVHIQPGVACDSGIEGATPGLRHRVAAERSGEATH